VRHLLLDTGAGYELKANKTGALGTLVVSTLLTLLIWGFIYSGGAH
jgi:succinate dehydrogenase / fumarate reductase cytochrome b subunit